MHNIRQQINNQIADNTEWLETTEGDEVECIGVENLEGILDNFLRRLVIEVHTAATKGTRVDQVIVDTLTYNPSEYREL